MRDDPIAGAARAVYLDGDAWSATGLVRTFPAGLTCFNNTLKWLPRRLEFTVDWPTNAGERCGTCACAFLEDTDFPPGAGVARTAGAFAPTAQQCCELCGADPLCAGVAQGCSQPLDQGVGGGSACGASAATLTLKVARANHTAVLPAARSA